MFIVLLRTPVISTNIWKCTCLNILQNQICGYDSNALPFFLDKISILEIAGWNYTRFLVLQSLKSSKTSVCMVKEFSNYVTMTGVVCIYSRISLAAVFVDINHQVWSTYFLPILIQQTTISVDSHTPPTAKFVRHIWSGQPYLSGKSLLDSFFNDCLDFIEATSGSILSHH